MRCRNVQVAYLVGIRIVLNCVVRDRKLVPITPGFIPSVVVDLLDDVPLHSKTRIGLQVLEIAIYPMRFLLSKELLGTPQLYDD